MGTTPLKPKDGLNGPPPPFAELLKGLLSSSSVAGILRLLPALEQIFLTRHLFEVGAQEEFGLGEALDFFDRYAGG